MRFGRSAAAWLTLVLVATGWGAERVSVAPPSPPGERVEQSVYIPYDKLWEVFEKKGRGVFLPYEEFMKLWQAAETARTRKPDAKPPVMALITEVSGVARVGKDVVTVDATATIEVLQAGWHEVPLQLGDVAIVRAELDGEPARLVGDRAGYRIMLHTTNATPRVYALQLSFAKAYTKTPGHNSVSFASPVAPISRWEVRIPEAGVAVDITPKLAATDAPPADDNAGTRVLAFVGATPTVRIDWTPRAEGAKGLQALANVRSEQEVRVDEGVTHTRVVLDYEISRTALGTLTLTVPAGQRIVNVFDENVREWRVAEQPDGSQRVSVQLFEPAKGKQRLVVELERYAATARVVAPNVSAHGVTRQQGVVVVRMAAGLRAEAVAHDGLLQVDARELPPAMAGKEWDFAYRYAALPFTLDLAVEAVAPRIRVDAVTAAHVQPDMLTLELVTVHAIERAGVFALGLSIPDGMDVREVTGSAAGNATPAAVASHHLDDVKGGYRLLTVNLARKSIRRIGLRVRLERALSHPDLLEPTGKPVDLGIALPRTKVAGVEWENGHVVVFGPESLRINPTRTKGLQPVSYAQATAVLPVPPRNDSRSVLAFRYAADVGQLGLAVERRAPYVTAFQFLAARVDSGVISYTAGFTYDVRYSGVKALRLGLPAAVAERARLTTVNMRHAAVDEPAAALPDGYRVWKIEGETEIVGSRQVRLVWEERMDELAVGCPIERPVPRLIPLAVDRAWGQIVLAKAESIDVAGVDTQGLRPIDPHHDLREAAPENAARAFEFHGDWALALAATRYEPQEVKTTSIERGVVRMVTTRGGLTSVQAIYRMRSARQRLVLALPGDVRFDDRPVRLNGRPVTLERGSAGQFFVPLVATVQDAPFVLELRYVVAQQDLTIRPPEFPDEPAVQQVYLAVYLPREQAYLGYRGPWTDQIVWVTDGLNTWPRGARDNNWLLRWVTDGTEVDRAGLENFATDGRCVLYSSLRPASGAAGALRVVTLRNRLLQTVLIVLGVLLGLALLPVSLGRRAVVVGGLIGALVLLAVFAPSCARAVVNSATVGAAVMVLVIWGLWFLLYTLPRSEVLREWQAARAAARVRRRSPPPVPPPPAPRATDKGGDSDA
jgi:hypothetical protein